MGSKRLSDLASPVLVSRFRDLTRRHQRGGVAPGVADVVGDIGNLPVRQFGVGRHRTGIRRARRRHRLRAVEDDTKRAGGIGRLKIGIAGQRRIDPRRAAAVGLVAGDTGVGVDRRARRHVSLRRRGDHGLRRARRKIFQINRDGADITFGGGPVPIGGTVPVRLLPQA